MRPVRISFPSCGQQLVGNLIVPDAVAHPLPGVLVLPGWQGRAESHHTRMAIELAKKGCVAMAVSLRGHGQSEGDILTLTRGDHLQDVLAAFEYLAQQQSVDPERLGTFGVSYGGYLASLATEQVSLRWLAMRAPPIYPDHRQNKSTWDDPVYPQAERPDMIYRHLPAAHRHNRVFQVLARFAGDILFVESEFDQYTPRELSETYLEAARVRASSIRHEFIEDADHGLNDNPEIHQRVNELVINWFAQRFNPLSSPER